MNAEIAEVVAPVLGHPCWGVHWDCQTGLNLEFGSPELGVERVITREPDPARPLRHLRSRLVHIHGEHSLWVEIAYWKLTLEDMPTVTQSSSFKRIRMGTSRLGGQALTGVEVDSRTGFSRFTFDLGAVLEVRRVGASDDYGMWTLASWGLRRVVEIRGDGCFRLQATDATVEEWRPMRQA